MPDWPLVRQYYQEAGIEEADQNQQYCCVTGEEARDEYCRSTPGQSEAKGEGPAPEDMDAIANRRRAEKIQRLVQLYSTMDLTGLSPRQRVQQDQEMRSMYGAKSEGWLDKSLAAAKKMQEQTPPRPTGDEDIVLQVRRRLSMRNMARLKDPHTAKQLMGIKAQATKRLQDTLPGYLEWLPDDDQRPDTTNVARRGTYRRRRSADMTDAPRRASHPTHTTDGRGRISTRSANTRSSLASRKIVVRTRRLRRIG
jgi:hypothetical protein